MGQDEMGTARRKLPNDSKLMSGPEAAPVIQAPLMRLPASSQQYH